MHNLLHGVDRIRLCTRMAWSHIITWCGENQCCFYYIL